MTINPRTGTIVKTRDGRWQPMIRLADGSKKRLKPLPKGTSEAKAREAAQAAQERADALGLRRPAPPTELPDPKTEADEWFALWHAARVRRGLSSARVSRGDWTTHIRPVLGGKHPKAWTRDDFRRLSKSLDDKVTSGAIGWKTAMNAWGTATKMASDAAEAKDDRIRCRKDNPADGVRGPDRGERTALQYLYPSEFLKLTASEDVPLAWRRIIAVATYSYARIGELRPLTWADVDLEHGTISITKSLDAFTGKLKSTKNKSPRRVPIETELLPLLQVMHREAGGVGPVLEFSANTRHQAESFRLWLRKAGIDRSGLFERGHSVRPIRIHDCRSSGCTWAAVRGDDLLKIMQRAGHKSPSVTMRYVREAEVLRHGFGTPFPPIPASLLARATGSQKNFYPKNLGKSVGGTGFEPAAGTALPDEFEKSRGVSGTQNTPTDAAKYADAGRVCQPAEPREPSPREALVAALGAAIGSGDLEAARVAHEALGRLLGTAEPGRAAVVDLGAARRKRG